MPSFTTFIRLCVALAMAMISVPLLLGSTASAAPGDKWFVCKYVGTPGVDEILQTGQNPISVSESAIKVTPVVPGTFFADDQGRSYVLVQDTGQPEPDASLCPPPDGGDDECPDLDGDQPPGFQCEPNTETEQRDLGPLLDCEAMTITTLHQERTRTQTFNADTQEWVFGPFSDWVTVDSTVEEATEQDCPVIDPPDPIVDPPVVDPPAPVVDPPAPTLPNTGTSPYLTALGLMGALILAAGSTLFMRNRKVRVPKA